MGPWASSMHIYILTLEKHPKYFTARPIKFEIKALLHKAIVALSLSQAMLKYVINESWPYDRFMQQALKKIWNDLFAFLLLFSLPSDKDF